MRYLQYNDMCIAMDTSVCVYYLSSQAYSFRFEIISDFDDSDREIISMAEEIDRAKFYASMPPLSSMNVNDMHCLTVIKIMEKEYAFIYALGNKDNPDEKEN